MKKEELEKRVEWVDAINVAIGQGHKIYNSIYKRMDYSPKVEIRAITSSGFAVVAILEGELEGVVEGYYYSDHVMEEIFQVANKF